MSFNRIYILGFCCILAAGLCSCNMQKFRDNALILKNYSSDLHYNYNHPLYFIPMPVQQKFFSAYRSFNPSAEYDETSLDIFSPSYIQLNIHEIYSVFLNSEKIPFIIQFPNRKIFDTWVAELQKKPVITKSVLRKLLRFEYGVDIVDEGIDMVSANFVHIQEDALYNGEPRYWLSEADFLYFTGDDFVRDMNVIVTWIKGKKWNDLNSTVYRRDRHMYLYTCDPSNNLPVIHDISRVTLFNADSDTYMTSTGYYTFKNPYNTETRTFENNDGSLDILYPDDTNALHGIRIYISGSVAEIDRNRRVIPTGA